MKQSLKAAFIILALTAGVSACIKLASDDAEASTNAPKSKPMSFGVEHVGSATTYSIHVITDPKTKCEYISVGDSITPRMYSDGIQVCGDSTYPNGER